MSKEAPLGIDIWRDIGIRSSKEESEWLTDDESSALWDRVRANMEAIWA